MVAKLPPSAAPMTQHLRPSGQMGQVGRGFGVQGYYVLSGIRGRFVHPTATAADQAIRPLIKPRVLLQLALHCYCY